MHPFVCHFIGGEAFVTGNALIVAAIFVFAITAAGWRRCFGLLLALAGIFCIAASSTPIPGWLNVIALILLAGWLGTEALDSSRWRAVARFAMLGIVALLYASEWPHCRTLRLPSADYRLLVVVGDSLSAPRVVEPDIVPWPELLSQQHPVTVINLAEGGATLQSALQQMARLPDTPSVVLLEIGGNDLLGKTSPEKFQTDLRALFAAADSRQHKLVMLELPLPPFSKQYGAIQRGLAKEFGVVLVPKRLFAKVFNGTGTTTDGIHLTPAGQQNMANTIWRVIAPLFSEATPQTTSPL